MSEKMAHFLAKLARRARTVISRHGVFAVVATKAKDAATTTSVRNQGIPATLRIAPN
jgi:hypothetical protein